MFSRGRLRQPARILVRPYLRTRRPQARHAISPAQRPQGTLRQNASGHESNSTLLDQIFASTAYNLAFWSLNTFLALHLCSTYVVSIRPTWGPSMLPTIGYQGDWVILSKLNRRGHNVRVGDIVSYISPMRPESYGIKRIVGMPGDFVARDTPDAGEGWLVQVPAGHCWVAGDNLPWSRDSRQFGPLPLALIRGKVLGRFWPDPKWYHNPMD